MRRTGTIGAYSALDMLEGADAYKPFPVMYALHRLTNKTTLDRTEETYTLSVDHPSHRFDSEGVISKNTAADAVRLAMLKCHRWRHPKTGHSLERQYGCRMLLQVHDELIFECPQDVAPEARDVIKEIMEHPFPTDLIVPLDVSIGLGSAWNKAK